MSLVPLPDALAGRLTAVALSLARRLILDSSTLGAHLEQPESLWGHRRSDLRRALDRVDVVLGDLYAQIVDALDKPLTVGRLIVASHCVREIANNLVDHLEDVEGLPEYVDGSKQRQKLAKTWVAHESLLGPVDRPIDVVAVSSPTAAANLMAVPTALVEQVRLVAEVEVDGSDRAGMRMSALMTGQLDHAQSPSVRLLRQTLRFFYSYVHLRHGEPVDLPDRDEALRHLERFEEALMGRVGDFFARRSDILDLLERANARTKGGEG